MLDLPDDWVWDFWTGHDGVRHHAFFLHAPRSLGDPDLRHRAARVGHAVSDDLVVWKRLPDPVPAPMAGAHDDLATWTGSVVRGDDGRWWMFTSGLAHHDDGSVQRVGSAVSADLQTWERTDLLLEADERWYAGADHTGETHWRDPFVTRGEAGTWHMLLTAKAPPGDRGAAVVGHATSSDLLTWAVGPPLGPPDGRFDQAEVVSLARVDGRWVAVFSCLGPEMPGAGDVDGGVWTVPVAWPPDPARPWRLADAVRLADQSRYVGRVVTDGVPGPVLLAFRNEGPDRAFVGGIADPVPVGWRDDGRGLRPSSPRTPGSD